MIPFELHQLEAFVAIVDHVTVTAAAAHLRLPQPALSRKLRMLEEAINVKLFARNGSRMILTPAGEMFLVYAHGIMDLCRLAMVNKLN